MDLIEPDESMIYVCWERVPVRAAREEGSDIIDYCGPTGVSTVGEDIIVIQEARDDERISADQDAAQLAVDTHRLGLGKREQHAEDLRQRIETAYVFDAVCFVYTCRRLIAVCSVYTCRRLIDLLNNCRYQMHQGVKAEGFEAEARTTLQEIENEKALLAGLYEKQAQLTAAADARLRHLRYL